jgi:hypothetical protein
MSSAIPRGCAEGDEETFAALVTSKVETGSKVGVLKLLYQRKAT